MADLTKSLPTDENLERLKTVFNTFKKDISFRTFWSLEISDGLPPAPDNKIPYVYGNSISDFTKRETKGKWVLVDFWGTWCTPCVAEMPELQDFYTKNRSDSILIVTIAYKDNAEKIKSFMIRNKYTFPVALVDRQFVRNFGITEYPTQVLITPDNRFLKILGGAIHWSSYLRIYSLLF